MPVKNRNPNREYLAASRRDRKYRQAAKGEKAPRPSALYVPQSVLGACSKCKRLGNVDFPPGTFNWNDADKLMDRRKIVIYCPQCDCNTEFIPVPPDRKGEDAVKWIHDQERRIRQRELSGQSAPARETILF